jgi:hypothetical protein
MASSLLGASGSANRSPTLKSASATLTPRTAIGSAAPEFDDLQWCSAAGASPSLVALGQKGALGHALDELFGAGATRNGGLEDLAHLQKQALELARRKLIDPLGWVNARLEQDLVGVNVPDAGNDFLIH